MRGHPAALAPRRRARDLPLSKSRGTSGARVELGRSRARHRASARRVRAADAQGEEHQDGEGAPLHVRARTPSLASRDARRSGGEGSRHGAPEPPRVTPPRLAHDRRHQASRAPRRDEPHDKAAGFHDLRATGLTWMAVRGDEPLRIMQRAGHEDFATTQIYIRTAEAVRDGFGAPFPPLPPSPPSVYRTGLAILFPQRYQSGTRDSKTGILQLSTWHRGVTSLRSRPKAPMRPEGAPMRAPLAQRLAQRIPSKRRSPERCRSRSTPGASTSWRRSWRSSALAASPPLFRPLSRFVVRAQAGSVHGCERSSHGVAQRRRPSRRKVARRESR